MTLPKNLKNFGRDGDDLNKHVKIEKLNPYYDLIFEDNDVLSVSGNKSNFEAQIKKLHRMISKDIESSCVYQKGNIISRFQKRAQWEEVHA